MVRPFFHSYQQNKGLFACEASHSPGIARNTTSDYDREAFFEILVVRDLMP